MSLKAFHTFFIAVAAVFSFGFSVWAFTEHQRTGAASAQLLGVLAIVAGCALVAYEFWFQRKLRGIDNHS